MSKARESNLSTVPITPAPNARPIRIEAVAAVELFKVEELKESQAAACGRRPLKAVTACDSFYSSRSPRVTSVGCLGPARPAIRRLVWRMGKRCGDRTFLICTRIGHTNRLLVGDNHTFSVKTGALGAKRSAIVREWL